MSVATGTGSRSAPLARLRRWLPWAALFLVTLLVAALLASPTSGEPLDPRNPGADGAQAVAQVLNGRGVRVEVVSGVRTVTPEQAGPGTTVLLSGTDHLGPTAGASLLQRVGRADRVVVRVPDPASAPGPVLGLDVQVSRGSGGTVGAECEQPWVRPGEALSTWDVLLAAGGADRAGVGACFPPSPGHNLGGAREAAVLSYPATPERPETVLVGAGSAWTNARVTEEANAAVALRLLGTGDRVLWVLPQPTDVEGDAAASLWQVLPRNLTASVVLIAAAALVLAWWRGRRLGGVVVEPLPTVVRATETTLNRGRLYRQGRDRGHALAAAQAGARRRMAPRLGLPSGSTPPDLVRAVA
jgi:hypothetical protein